jgi:hypothetical protein
MNKYNIVISNISGTDLYNFVYEEFTFDEEGNKITIDTKVLINITLQEIKNIINT